MAALVAASTLLRQPAVRLESLIEKGEVALDLEPSTRALDVGSLEAKPQVRRRNPDQKASWVGTCATARALAG